MTDLSKRSLMKVAALTALAGAALVGCGKKEEPAVPAPAPAAEAPKAEPLKIAFAYVGPVGDGGWTFAHDNARKALEKEFGDKIVTSFVESVPESADATRIAENAKAACPHARVLVRAFDREHALELVKTGGVDYVVRETFESAMLLGREAVLATGATPEEADAVMTDLRRLDGERFDLEVAGDAFAGRALVLGHLRNKENTDGTAPASAV